MSLPTNRKRGTHPAVRMGEFAVASDQGSLETLLGSCIGLALYERKRKIAGLAHIVLPQSRNGLHPPGKCVDTAIPALLAAMEELAEGKVKPTAKIAGGANMFATKLTQSIGDENLAATQQLLKKLGIPIIGSHCGGEKGRRMSLEVGTGNVTIAMVGCEGVRL